ncbi:uncharacterized protein PHALS_11834 [Plasmopara halstedii]|uniref:Uncharacterized protein n=1 Tax=Plasmopara halstedii TaxID=4781 RepID=A0A0P1AKT7_PLAHL|nr:uncharacterized protein PHALS_11834 [Plasmopara halstedii]CEG41493.1 hypothetical protein PHALS_11834 [Plasmopara halstedii]|eukprot:XP_024577862.1 hypothetical protein PHALS_11834 [Plasmopara halstedii]
MAVSTQAFDSLVDLFVKPLLSVRNGLNVEHNFRGWAIWVKGAEVPTSASKAMDLCHVQMELSTAARLYLYNSTKNSRPTCNHLS